MSGAVGLKQYTAFAVLSCVGSLIMMSLYARPEDLWSFLVLVAFAVWIIGPHLLGSLIGRRLIRKGRGGVATAYLVLLVISLLGGFGLYLKVRFLDPPDAQAALIFLSVPLVQWVFTGLALLPATLADMARR